MPMPESHKKERLSLAYVQAVVAAAGAHYNSEDSPEYGLDCTIKQVSVMENGKCIYGGYPLYCQIKSTTDWIEENNFIVYDLEADAYNKLVSFEGKSAILIVFRMPKKETEWLNCTENTLELRNCCYWIFINGEPTTNISSIRIRLPRSQIFNPSAIEYLFTILRQKKGSLE